MMEVSEENASISPEIFDLHSYSAQYEGYTKLLRLQFIAANSSTALRQQAYTILLQTLRDSLYSQFYQQIIPAMKSLVNGADIIKSDLYLDENWIQNISIITAQRLESLEYALTDAKSKMVKESIRSALSELANFYYCIGNLNEAMKWYFRCKEYCSTPRHFCDFTLNVFAIAIDTEKYFHTYNNLIKASDCGSDSLMLSKLRAASALVSLNEKQFKIAGLKFLSVSIDLGRNFNTTITCEDIALYGALLSIATFDRAELRKHVLVERKYFLNNFLPLCPAARDITLDYYNGRYSQCLRRLAQLKPRLLLDLHLSRHVPTLYAMITDRCILQYCKPYSVMDMNRMSATLDIDIVQLESLVEKLAVDGKLCVTINSQMKTIQNRTVNKQSMSTMKVLQLSEVYVSRLKRDILHLSLLQHGFLVDLTEDEFKDKYGVNLVSTTATNNSSNSTSGYVDGIRGMVGSNIAADEDLLDGDGECMVDDGEDEPTADVPYF